MCRTCLLVAVGLVLLMPPRWMLMTDAFSTPSGTNGDGLPFRAYQEVPHGESSQPQQRHVPYIWERLPPEMAQNRADDFYKLMSTRRAVRFFSKRPVPKGILEACIATAGTAPSGAHQQPWTFCVVQNSTLKQQIRELVEEEERLNYQTRMSQEWKDDLDRVMSGLHPDWIITKPYLTDAPYIVVLMKRLDGGIDESTGETIKHYYVEKSCGICAGIFSAALHNANLATLCSTPMHAEEGIRKLLQRPKNEKVFLLMPVGYPSSECTVPFRNETTGRRPLNDIMKIF